MTARRPSKPWRAVLSGPTGEISETPFTSQNKTYEFVHASLGPGSPAHTAKVMQWEDGRWWHYETLHPEDITVEEAS
jgi:hypothetical protein